MRLLARVFFKAEWFASGDGVARDAGTPMTLDMGDDEIVAGKMIDPGRARGIVHRIGHVPHESDVLAQIVLLPDGEGASAEAVRDTEGCRGKDDAVESRRDSGAESLCAIPDAGAKT